MANAHEVREIGNGGLISLFCESFYSLWTIKINTDDTAHRKPSTPSFLRDAATGVGRDPNSFLKRRVPYEQRASTYGRKTAAPRPRVCVFHFP
jgi:hypothetical protein